MGERPTLREQSARLPTEQLVAHFERHGHKLTQAELDLLIESITVADLTDDPLTDIVGRVPLATIRGREITLDRQFELLSVEQQMHVLLHEYGHSLSRFWREYDADHRYQAIDQLVSALPSNQVSYYVGYLESALEESPDKPEFLQEERLAEVLAQYLESDRTFSGFIRAKLLEFPGNDDLSEEERQRFADMAPQVGELGEYLDIADNEEEREAFLAHHSDLLPHYQLWRELTRLFDETDFTTLGQQVGSFDEDEWREDVALVQHLHPEPISPDRSPQTALHREPSERPSSFLEEFITFWRIFPR